MKLEKIGLQIPTIYLPNENIDKTKWAVVACDQYTSQPEYWENVTEFVGESPSALNLIFPEVYLEAEGKDEKITRINETMDKYLEEGILVPTKPGFILVDRKISPDKNRKGLIVSIDLDQYDYDMAAEALIRSTEGTIMDRLPPRIKIRENSKIETPHIMVLIDDPQKTVIEPLFNQNPEKVYDFELMSNGGHIKGHIIDNESVINDIAKNIAALADPLIFNEKYNVSNRKALLYAVGDGNHSLATAKVIWEKLKENNKDNPEIMNHPARYALVELVNLYDDSLQFEPIHRLVFNVDSQPMLQQMEVFFQKQGSHFQIKYFETKEDLLNIRKKIDQERDHNIFFTTGDKFGLLTINSPKLNLEVGSLQSFLDNYLKDKSEAKIDFVHGEEIVFSLGAQQKNIGFFLPVISKHDLFKTVIMDGALPRKTFSMGEAHEKRYYLECRKIK